MAGGALALAARADAARRRVIGLLAQSIPASEIASGRFTNPAPGIIKDGLRERGWIDGENVRLVWKTVEGKYERWPEVIREFVRMPVDVLVVFTDGAAQAALAETRTIPVVFSGIGTLMDDTKLVSSLRRPGGNLTGLSMDGLNLGAKRLELLKAAVPSVNRVAFLGHYSGSPLTEPYLSEQTKAVARKLSIETFFSSFAEVSEIPRAFSELVGKRANGIMVGESPYMFYREYQLPIHALALKHRIPAMYRILNSADSGGLMAYAPDILDVYRAAPRYVDKILRGANPAEIPVETVSKFEFVINLQTAKAMGLAIQPAILAAADRVIR